MAYMLNGYAQTPNTAAIQVSDGSDMTLAMRLRVPDVTPASNVELISHWQSFNSDGYRLYLSSFGDLTFQAFGSSSNLGVLVAETTLGWTAGIDIWIKMEFDSGVPEVNWYSSTTDTNDIDSVVWGTAKETDAFSFANWTVGASVLTIGASRTGANPLESESRVYRALVYGAGASPVFDADFSDPTTWTYS